MNREYGNHLNAAPWNGNRYQEQAEHKCGCDEERIILVYNADLNDKNYQKNNKRERAYFRRKNGFSFTGEKNYKAGYRNQDKTYYNFKPRKRVRPGKKPAHPGKEIYRHHKRTVQLDTGANEGLHLPQVFPYIFFGYFLIYINHYFHLIHLTIS